MRAVSGEIDAAADPEALLAPALTLLTRPYGRERSVKLIGGRALDQRLLCSTSLDALGPDPRSGLAGALAQLEAPAGASPALAPYVGSAAYVHFGVEAEDGAAAPILKVYLEFRNPPPRARDMAFVAAKWRRGSDKVGVSRYLRRPAEALDLLLDAIAPELAPIAAPLAARAARAARPALLEVLDDGAPRRSLDINFYDAQIDLADEAETVLALFGRLGCAASAAERFISGSGGKRLGHLAMGRSRDETLFATIYYGAQQG